MEKIPSPGCICFYTIQGSTYLEYILGIPCNGASVLVFPLRWMVCSIFCKRFKRLLSVNSISSAHKVLNEQGTQ